MHLAIVSVGSNINPAKNSAYAAKILSQEQTLLCQSNFIVTKPDGYQAQPDFLNGAFLIETSLDYDAFNQYLKQVEKRLGRIKGPIKSGPRTIDLDIIIWDENVIHSDFYAKDYVRHPVQEVLTLQAQRRHALVQ